MYWVQIVTTTTEDYAYNGKALTFNEVAYIGPFDSRQRAVEVIRDSCFDGATIHAFDN